MNFKVIIYASDRRSYEICEASLLDIGILKPLIYWCDSSQFTRESVINLNLGKWLLFLDHDCSIDTNTFDYIKSLTSDNINTDNTDNTVIAALYANLPIISYLQKTHNFIANTWLEQSFSFSHNYKLILGGAFLIFSNNNISYTAPDIIWGAEDKALAYRLNKMNFLFKLDYKIQVFHNTSNSLFHFVRRAYLHGQNDVKYITENKNKTRYSFWIQKVGFVNLNLLPLIGFHFCIQKVAKLVQKVRQ